VALNSALASFTMRRASPAGVFGIRLQRPVNLDPVALAHFIVSGF
jgi:hypothetical protein